jgi:hypothetical protein
MASASDFRDSFVRSLLIGYDWERSAHFAELALCREGSAERRFRIDGLSAWAVFEDFQAQHITQCTLLRNHEGIYLCLDPHTEGARSEKDNYWLIGTAVAECPN